MITLSVFIPQDGQQMTLIRHGIQTEILPLSGRYQRMDHHLLLGLRTNAHQPGNHQIGESRVIIITTALTVAHQPGTILLIEILSNIRATSVMLTLHVFLHLTEIYGIADDRLCGTVQVVGKSRQRLTGSEGPYSTIPLAGTYAMRTELRMTALGGSQSVRSREAFLIHQLQPGCLETLFLRHIEIPRDKADSLAHIGRGIFLQGLEELVLLVPQILLDLLFQRLSLLVVHLCLVAIPIHPVDSSQSTGIAIHITVDSRTGILLATGT